MNEATTDSAAVAEGGGAAEAGAPGGAISEEEVSALLEKGGTDGVQPYDLASRRINRMQLPMLDMICRGFATRASGSLSGVLGRDAVMQFESLQTVKAGEFQAGLVAPSTVAVIRLKPLPGPAFVNVAPDLLLVLLDGFFGGNGRAPTDLQAAAAPAAQRFLGLMVRAFAADFAAAWAPVTPVEFELVKQETNPRLLQLGGAPDPLIVARFRVEFGASSGHIDWILPESLTAPVREALGSEGAKPAVKSTVDWSPELRIGLQGAELETHAVLAEARISLREVVRLVPGDIIPIEAPQQVTLLAGTVPLYRGRFGVSHGHNAMKILPGGRA
jgi:flagellar motor switch protein FliM